MYIYPLIHSGKTIFHAWKDRKSATFELAEPISKKVIDLI